MSIYGLRSLLSLLLLLLSCFTNSLLAGPSEIARNHCGADLAKLLSVLCKGKYGTRQSATDEPDITDESTSLTQECCTRPCSVAELSRYCAVKPSPHDKMVAMMAMSSLQTGNDASRASGPSLPVSKVPAKTDTGSDRGAAGGRMANLIRSHNRFDAAPLLDTRLESDYESSPYLQRRRR